MKKIGFANLYYTLWDVWNETMYKVDHNGKAWPTHINTHFDYIKNISIDLDKVKAKYPDLEINEELKGQSRSFIKNREEDLSPELLKFGKYSGYTVQEVSEKDFDYILWLIKNCYSVATVEICKEIPKVMEYLKNIEDAENKAIIDREEAFAEMLRVGIYEFTADRNLRMYEDFAYITVDGITFKFNAGAFSYNEYNGHSYGLPIINGKAKRMKGKAFKVEFTEDRAGEHMYEVIVNKIEIIK